MNAAVVACVATLITLLAHIFVLSNSPLDPIVSPISELSRGAYAWVHAVGLIAFATAYLAFQPGARRWSAGLGRFNATCLLIWLLLVPLTLLVNPTWLGGYERIVGRTYLIWVFGLAAARIKRGRHLDTLVAMLHE